MLRKLQQEKNIRKLKRKRKEKAKKKKNLKKKPNKSTGKEFREIPRMMRKDNIEEDVKDMSTDEEDSEKDNVVKENKGEKNVVSSGIYHENRNKSVNSLLLFTTAELDDFNVGKYFTVYWPKPRSYYWGKLQVESIFR